MKVSVIIPALNAEAYVKRGMETALSAVSDLNEDWEIIAVDNQSTDGTLAHLNRFADRFPNKVRVLICPVPGAAAARNFGVQRSTGQWLQFLDIDDTLAPGKISGQLEMAGQAAWVIGGYQHVHTDGSLENVLPNHDLWKGLFHNFRTGCTHSNLIRRDALEAIGGWNEKLSCNQDPDVHFRLLRQSVPYVIDSRILSFYHHHDSEARVTATAPRTYYTLREQLLLNARLHLESAYPLYWRENKPFFLGAILKEICRLATYDLPAAHLAYIRHFKIGEGARQPRQLPIVSRYTRLYPYLGFRNVEALRLLLARVLPEGLKARLKG